MLYGLKWFRVLVLNKPISLFIFGVFSFILLLIYRLYLVPRFSGIDDIGYLWTSLNQENIDAETHVLFRFRVGMTYTLFLAKKIFGIESSGYWIITILAEMISMILISLAIKSRFGVQPAILLIIIWSFYPLSYHQTTYYMPGSFQVFFISIAIYLILLNYKKRDGLKFYFSFFFAGISLGIGYLYKEDTAILVFILIIAGLIVNTREYKAWFIFGCGAGSVFFAESTTYFLVYNDAFIRIHSSMGQAASVSGEYSKIWSNDAYIKSLFILPHKVGIYWWLLIPSIIYSLKKSKSQSFLVTSVIIMFLWLQFGSGSFSEYEPLPKVPRYTVLLWPMMAVLIALWLSKLYQENKPIYVVLMLTLITTSILSLLFFSIQAGERSRNAISAARFIQNSKISEIYTDQYTKKLLTILGDDTVQYKVLYHANYSEAKSDDVDLKVQMLVNNLSDKYLLLDYQQSKIFTSSYGLKLPGIIQNPPSDWDLIWNAHAYRSNSIERNVLQIILKYSDYIPITSIRKRVEVFVKDMIVNDEVSIYKVPSNWQSKYNITN